MGIKGLAKLLSDEAPDCVCQVPLSSLNGRKVAIDASMAIYQFLIAVRQGGPNNAASMLTNADGETTSHIQGLFNRTIRFLTEGIRPVFVFDGKPPSLKKTNELVKRQERRNKAQTDLKVAQDEGNVEEIEKLSKRLVRAGKKENEDCMRLLKLMGIPIVLAPCEAEAQAATLAQEGLVYAVGTEDMDALTFKTPILLRKMTFANGSKFEIQTMNYKKALEGLELTHDEFVDLCILLGCDYCDSIRGVGPKTALKLIREHKSIEKILENIDRSKYGIPDSWLPKEVKKEKNEDDNEEKEKEDLSSDEKGDQIPIYVGARNLFNEHEVHKNIDLKWKACEPEGLTKFLVDEMGFNAERVQNNIAKLQKAFKATSKPQLRMDSFFKVKPGSNNAAQVAKRKAVKEEMKNAKKQKKGSKGTRKRR